MSTSPPAPPRRGNRLRLALAERRLSVRWLARETGIPESALYRLTAGTGPPPRVVTALLIAQALGVEVGKLWPENDHVGG